MSDAPKCEVCGEPMPEGESMFKFHGYSGPCPKEPLPPKTPPSGFYFLDQDNDSHWYVVEAARRDEWDAWRAIPSDDERAWDAPEFAHAVGGAPNQIEFHWMPERK